MAEVPADRGEQVLPPDLIEENEYYMLSLGIPLTRVKVWGVEPSGDGLNITYQNPLLDHHAIFPPTLHVETNDRFHKFYKIQGHVYTPPSRELVGKRVAPKNMEIGKSYYYRDKTSPFIKITITGFRNFPQFPENIQVLSTSDPQYLGAYNTLGTRRNLGNTEKKFYKIKGELYSDELNAARKILPHMMAYSARPPGTMGPENTGGLLYKRWEQQFQRNRGATRRRRSRRQTRRRRS